MARLSVSMTFEASHGSFDIRKDIYNAIIYVEGAVRNGFVLGLDSAVLRKSLSDITSYLASQYLDDIVGRATNENLGLYMLHRLQLYPISAIRIVGDGHDVELFPSDINNITYPARLLYERARSLLYRDRTDDAILVSSEAISEDGTFAPAYNFRGRCNRTKERWDLALPDFEKAAELDHEFGESYRNIGNALLHLGRENEMIPAFSKAMDLMPESALAVNNRGFAYQRLGEWELALTDHARAVELDPNYAEAHGDMAAVLKVFRRMEESREHERISEELQTTGQDTYAKKPFY